MKMGAKLCVVLVAAGLLSTGFLVNAGYEGKSVDISTTVITPTGKEVRTISLSDKDIISIEKTIKSGEVQNALATLENPDANDNDTTTAKEILEAFLYKMQGMGLIPATFPVVSILSGLFRPKVSFLLPIISFGQGMSWIPLYPGEAFIGFMLRPIFMQYFGPFGYSGTLNVHLLPPRIEYWDMVGTHTLFVLGFVGVYIDLGQIGFGIPDLQFLFGEALVAGGVDWM